MAGAAHGPLQGVRVLELGTLIAAPFASRLFAEFGADVTKVEDPKTGDPIRNWRYLHDGTSLWWYVQSRNKKSIALNLKDPRAQQIARRLALDADVVIENYRPGVLEKWGLGYEQLRTVNPATVMVRISGYGQSGPMRDRPGFGAIAESMGGIRFVTGYPDRPPVRIGISIGDSIAALHAVVGALMALRHRDATGGRGKGEGQMVDVALYEAVFNMMESTLPEYDVFGAVRSRTGGSLPGIVPSNTYECAGGEAIVVAGNGDAIFRRLMTAIGREDLANDPALARNEGRVKRAQEIDGAIQDWCARRPIGEALSTLTAADVPVSRIYSVADMARDAQFQARQMFEQQALPDGTPMKVPAVVPRLSATPGGTRWLGPRLGEHTDYVLRELGYDDAAIAALRAEGVI
jgi:crotonobetainyl-CoA:carnitine CoA-transferase CaiB-like acyl-CoA transferase